MAFWELWTTPGARCMKIICLAIIHVLDIRLGTEKNCITEHQAPYKSACGGVTI